MSNVTKTPEWVAWREIKYRCHTPTSQGYKNYGARGIKVYDQWRKSFYCFLTHVGHRPSPEHSIDRIDNNKGYEPGNVRWATRVEQQNNVRTNKRMEYKGVVMTQANWARVLGIKYKSFSEGVRQGIPIQYYVDKYITNGQKTRSTYPRSASYKTS